MKIGFIGLGQMGTALAGHLMQAGHQVTVWNRSAKAMVICLAFVPWCSDSSAIEFSVLYKKCGFTLACSASSSALVFNSFSLDISNSLSNRRRFAARLA